MLWHGQPNNMICGACQAHARCRLGARTLLTLAGKEDLSCSVQFPHSSEYTLVVIVRLL
jgi:hypothetical protein